LIRFLLLLVTALLLTSCANQRTLNTPRTVNELAHWQVDGKIAIQYQGKTQTAYFKWQNHNKDYVINLHGPFGQGAAILKKDKYGVHLQADGQEHHADSAETLLDNSLGWSFPISDMNWWVRGVASPTAPIKHLQKNDNGQLQELQQQGWTIKYRKYQQTQQLTLPYKLVASRQNLTITLLLKQWQL